MEITVDDVDEGEIDKVAKALSHHVVQVSKRQSCNALSCPSAQVVLSTRLQLSRASLLGCQELQPTYLCVLQLLQQNA